MKKIILFIVLVLIIQGGYKIKLVLAQQKTEIKEMSDVVQTFLESFAHGDIDSMMKQVSQNYSDKDKEGNIIDYAKFKSILEKKLDAFAKKYSNYSIVDSEVTGSNIEGNKGSISVVFSWKGFNLAASKEESGKRARFAALAKEDGSWKITKIRAIRKKLEK